MVEEHYSELEQLLWTRPKQYGAFVAEMIAAFLHNLEPGTRVGLYGCSQIAKWIAKHRRYALEHIDILFILTTPGDATQFEGYPLVAFKNLAHQNLNKIIILSVYFEKEIADTFAAENHRMFVSLDEIIAKYHTKQTVSRFIEEINAHVKQEAARVRLEIPPDKKLVIFFTQIVAQHMLKTMQELYRLGYAVLVFTERLNITSAISLMYYANKGYFHGVYEASFHAPYELLEFEKLMPPHIIHAEVGMWSSEALSTVIQNSPTPVAVEYCDFPQTVFANDEDAMAAMRCSTEIYEQELEARSKVYQHASGVIMKDSPETLHFLEELYNYKPKNVLQFYHYLDDKMATHGDLVKWSAGSKEIHIVYAGAVVNDPNWHNYPIYKSLLDAGEILAQQHIHLSVYNASDSCGQGFKEYIDLSQSCPYFHYHYAIPYADLKHVLPLHDFGWFCFDFSNTRENPFFHRITMGSKVFTYLEAGLPVLISPEQQFMARMVTEELGSGIPVSFKNLHVLKRILLERDWGPIHANILKARENWTYQKHGHKLRAFYDLLIRHQS